MELNINGKSYPLDFGFDFIDYVNQHNGMAMEGMKTNVGGAAMLNANMATRMPSALRLLIKGGTSTLKSKPSNEDIKIYINELSKDDEKWDEVFDEIESEIKKEPATCREMGISSK